MWQSSNNALFITPTHCASVEHAKQLRTFTQSTSINVCVKARLELTGARFRSGFTLTQIPSPQARPRVASKTIRNPPEKRKIDCNTFLAISALMPNPVCLLEPLLAIFTSNGLINALRTRRTAHSDSLQWCDHTQDDLLIYALLALPRCLTVSSFFANSRNSLDKAPCLEVETIKCQTFGMRILSRTVRNSYVGF